MKSIEEKVVELLRKQKLKISFAESCTGGMLVSNIVNVSGSSSVLSESYVTYSNEAKVKILGVNKETIDRYTVYSSEVALEMATGLKKITKAEIAVSVTSEVENELNSCKCYYTIISNDKTLNENVTFSGKRNEVRKLQTKHILERIFFVLSQY